MERFIRPDGEVGYTNGEVSLSISPDEPEGVIVELTASFDADEAGRAVRDRGSYTVGEISVEQLRDLIGLASEA